MANEEHLSLLRQGRGTWNRWRIQNPSIYPDLSMAELSEFFLFGINLSHANLLGAHLFKTNLLGANLKSANLQDTDLRDAELIGANLTQANLSRANLSWANLSKAKLVEATLNQADLSRANLSRTDFSRAQALGTNFSSTVLTGACIANLEIDATTNLEGAIASCLFLGSSRQNPNLMGFSQALIPNDFSQLLQTMVESVAARA
ncbi:MAG: pentapeptide repeat-containing protein [Timaviella obliquedivisa GSE-PSE-MK23-08B]|jgi:uncharacterized protein YjbI with pentapeptide repeats|nr:pentapeptide repeat-containing protein [Timaviella obliquedivisa GSE-PSE-MK23-08B]